MTTPIGLALLFLMAAAPALPWRATSGEVVRNRLLVPAWIGAATMVLAVVLGARDVAEVLAYGLGAFATAGIVRQFYLGVRGRRRALGESGPQALGRATRSNPRLYGGLVVHFGVVLIAVALAASAAHGASQTVRLRVDESAVVSGYKFTYVGAKTAKSGQKTTVSVGVHVQKGDRDLGVYAPAVSTYPNSTEGIGTPSVHTGLREDVYLTLVSSPNQQGRVTLGIRINTMIVWLWIGGGVMAIGTVLALAAQPATTSAPRFRRSRGPGHGARPESSRTSPREARSAVGCARGRADRGGVRGDPGAQRRLRPAAGRAREPPARERPAPAFKVTTLDGDTVTDADVAGKTVLVNFWNTWCIPCQEELPALKKFYADHANDSDFVMVGIVRQDDTKTVREFVTGEGIGWTIALDPSKEAALDFGTRGQPETFAISPSGQIVAYKPGPMSQRDLETFLSVARQSG